LRVPVLLVVLLERLRPQPGGVHAQLEGGRRLDEHGGGAVSPSLRQRRREPARARPERVAVLVLVALRVLVDEGLDVVVV
jgi:hypothetical protein